jgi:Tol biopolymer transport system component
VRGGRLLAGLLSVAAGPGLAQGPPAPEAGAPQTRPAVLSYPGEAHLRDVRQLTFGGENAEGYLSPDERTLVFQATRPGWDCDQIFTLPLAGGEPRLVSTGRGRTTCGYWFYPDGQRLLFSSTHLGGDACPPPPDRSQGYVWAVYPDYDIFTARPDGSDLKRLTAEAGYDAEATFAFDGSRIVFTSMRDGDLEIYTMRPDGSDLRRLTREPGYDGGAFFSHDGSRIVYRAHHPQGEEALRAYRELLSRNLVRPVAMEIFVMEAGGENRRQVTRNGAANFAPFFHPDGERIVFASNLADPGGRNFDLFLIRLDGTGLEQVTFGPSFDGFPMFTRDGRRLVFASNRFARERGETNLFVADWID